jgi:hypothetical protein
MVNQLAAFQNSLSGTLSANGEFPDVSDFMDALQEFMGARAIDLGEFEEEANTLKADVEGGLAAAETRLAMANLAAELQRASESGDQNDAVKTGIEREQLRPDGGEVARVAFTAPTTEFPQKLDTVLTALEADTVDQFNMSSNTLAAQMAAFEAMENRQA